MRIATVFDPDVITGFFSPLTQVNQYLVGWIGFFGICSAAEHRTMHSLEAHIRRRLRAIQMKHWKRRRTIAMRLTRRGMRRQTAWRSVYAGRKGIWKLSLYPGNVGLRNAYFAERGLLSLVERWAKLNPAAMVAPETG